MNTVDVPAEETEQESRNVILNEAYFYEARGDQPSAAEFVNGGLLDHLWSTVMLRRGDPSHTSYSASIIALGKLKAAEKFGEEAVECIASAAIDSHDALIYESADVLYHLITLWVVAGITPGDIWNELSRRENMSGIQEKRSR